MSGGAGIPIRTADALRVAPTEFETTTLYEPRLRPRISASWRLDAVAPGMLAPLNCHWYAKGSVPRAVTLKAALDPGSTACEAGGATIVGRAGWTVKVATALVVPPKRFVAVTK